MKNTEDAKIFDFIAKQFPKNIEISETIIKEIMNIYNANKTNGEVK